MRLKLMLIVIVLKGEGSLRKINYVVRAFAPPEYVKNYLLFTKKNFARIKICDYWIFIVAFVVVHAL